MATLRRPFWNSSGKLNENYQSYFKRMAAEYRSLATTSGNKNADAVAKVLADKADTATSVTWDDINAMEIALLRLQPDVNLSSVALRLRQRYREIAGPLLYQEYINSKPCDPTSSDYSRLRAELESLLSDIQRLEVVIPEREHLRNKFSMGLGAFTLLILAAGMAGMISLYSGKAKELDPMLAISMAVLSGAVGGFVSMQRRLQALPSESSSFSQLRYGWFSVALAPISGMIFAVLLYMLFSSKLLGGELFPQFSYGPPTVPTPGGTPEDSNGAYNLVNMRATDPKTVADFGKLIVWAFIGGFIERFVPDVLDRLIARSQTSENTTPPVAPPPVAAQAPAAQAPANSQDDSQDD